MRLSAIPADTSACRAGRFTGRAHRVTATIRRPPRHPGRICSSPRTRLPTLLVSQSARICVPVLALVLSVSPGPAAAGCDARPPPSAFPRRSWSSTAQPEAAAPPTPRRPRSAAGLAPGGHALRLGRRQRAASTAPRRAGPTAVWASNCRTTPRRSTRPEGPSEHLECAAATCSSSTGSATSVSISAAAG